MSINIEHEARLMLDYDEYQKILSNIEGYLEKHIIKNINIYLDDDSFSIIKSGNMLRIREINNNKYELTLKIQQGKSCKEINAVLTKEDEEKIINHNYIYPSDIRDALIKIYIDTSTLKPFMTLSTNRIEFIFDKYLICIDENQYNNIIDYNIEIESKISYVHAEEVLKDLINKYHLKEKGEYLVKSKRALLSVLK